MLTIRKSILGAAMLASLAALAVAPTQPASAAPMVRDRGHWVRGWHDGRFGWWWSGPEYWYSYPAPAYYNYYGPPPSDYVTPTGIAPQPSWYYCDSAKGYYPYVRSCASGWRAVPADPQSQPANGAPAATPPASGSSKL
jgi:hypothetical protein